MNNQYDREDRDLIPVEGNTTLKRDSFSKAIINTDKNAYEKYISLRDQRSKEREEIESIKSDLAEVKALLSQLAAKL
jgi:K+/H+ antiporter YhaU regulatory subunit KhtT